MKPEPTSIDGFFDDIITIDTPEGRRAALDRLCQGRDKLRAELESLLAAHERAGQFLDRPAAETHSGTAPSVAPDDYGRLLSLAALARSQSLQNPPATDVAPEAPPSVIPGFRIIRTLGGGGLGTVFEAVDEKLNRPVAIKVLRTGHGGARQRAVLHEARQAAALQDPAIVTIHNVIEDGPTPAIVMERVEGYPIDAALSALSFQQRAGVLREVSRALAVAHAAGIIHRDLKPDNVLVTPDLRPKILDFGLAVSGAGESEMLGRFEGSPLYTSPEQAAGLGACPASDVFAFGSMMFKVLTGKPAYAGRNAREVLQAICSTTPPFPRDITSHVPKDLQAICLACLSLDPGDRPTAALLTEEFGRYLAGEPVRLRPALYGSILQRRLSEQSAEVESWARQGMITRPDADRLQDLHRRLLADEDYWIIDAPRITGVQTTLYTSSWLVVVMALLLVWLVRDDLTSLGRWSFPLFGTGVLLAVGLLAHRRGDAVASASFLAAVVLSVAPTVMSILVELHWLQPPPPDVAQLFGSIFTNAQVVAATLTAFVLSILALHRLRVTGFAWTTAALGAFSYLTVLMLWNWLGREPEIQALWCLPLVAAEGVAIAFAKYGRVRWALPFDIVALVSLITCLDVIADQGPTLAMLGISADAEGFLTETRLKCLSYAINGFMFLGLMLLTETSRSADLRRISRVMEFVALPHILLPLYISAIEHKGHTYLWIDAIIYLAAAVLLVVLGPWRSRWRLLVTGLGGLAFGCHMLITVDLVPAKPFVLTVGASALTVALVAYIYVLRAPRTSGAKHRRAP